MPDPGPDPDWEGKTFDPNPGDQRFVELCTELFTRFGELSAPYSIEQIDQGLWKIHGDPYFLASVHLTDEAVPASTGISCVKSMLHLFTDFLAARDPEAHVGSLYMWWDHGWFNATPEFLHTVLASLIEVLKLPTLQCQKAALHGLGHLIGRQTLVEGAAAAIEAFIRENATASQEVLGYAQWALTGKIP
ncbi:MAG: hypothetical protein AB7J35_20890 [Dehalococcoidia bacterium]